MVDGYLNFDTRVDTSGFNKGTKAITKQSSKLGSVMSGAFSTALGFGIAQMAGQMVQSLITVCDQAIELASDMDEVQNVVDTAFGSMAYKCEEFADIAIDQFGMSKLSAKQTASTYMAMAKSMGLSMDAASDMAIETAKLTGDVASFYNISTDLASVKLKSIFTGETETLKDLGVVMTEVNLQQYALQKGITKSYSAMSQAEKVSLRYNFVMDSLADAQGDFARTSDSWANQTRVLSERFKELLSILGGGLIRVLTPVVQLINNILSALITMANAFANTLGKLFGFNKEIKAAKTSALGAAGAQDELADSTTKAGKAAQKSLASFDELNVLQSNSSSGSSSGGGGTGGSLQFEDVKTPEVDTSVFDKISDSVKRLQPQVDRLKESWKNLKDAMERLWNSEPVQKIASLFANLAKAIAIDTFEATIGSLTGIFDTLTGEIKLFQGALETISSLIKGDYKKAWESVGGSADGFTESIQGQKRIFDSMPKWAMQMFNNVLGGYANFIELADALTRTDWAKIWENFKGEVSNRIEEVKSNFSGLKSKISNDLSNLNETVSTKVKTFKDEMSKRWSEIKTNTSETWGNVKNSISNSLNSVNNFIKNTFIPAWRTAWNGVKNVFKSIWNSIAKIAESAVNMIISAINSCIRQLNKINITPPKWVTKVTGMGNFGFNIKELSKVTIPRLASGAVIPPNGEFLAMLGDQKNGRNLETPESLLRQIVREESGKQEIVVVIEGDTSKIFRVVQKEAQDYTYRTGKPAFG